jgi:transposase
LVPPPDDKEHDCGWKAYAEALKAESDARRAEIAELNDKLAALEKRLWGKKSERRKTGKMPPPVPPPKADPAATASKRAKLAALRDAKLVTEVVPVPVPLQQRTCPHCRDGKMPPVGEGKPSVVFEYVQPHFRKRIYKRETLSCSCGHIVTAPAPGRVGEKTRYAPSFIAHLIVSKCDDSIPQYRLEKAYKRLGIPVARSTMCDLIHRAAAELRPLHTAALALVPAAADVHADETSMRQLDLKGKAYIWDFVTPELVVYRYAPSRSGETPKKVLGDSTGRLVVDQYTGYNAVTAPGKRTRAGCLAHARRHIFEQREHPETAEALNLIGEIYKVEADAKNANIVGTAAHLELRRQRSRRPFAMLLCWARRLRKKFEPKSRMARAVRYVLKNRRALGQFLRFASIPPDNNVAEAALRRVALGRSNYLFVAHEKSGHDFAVLYTLVASCQKHDIEPIAYLTDVLTRVHTHPASRVQELLPHRWKARDAPKA